MGWIGSNAPRRRNTAIDSLRGLLVIAVILGHFAEVTDRASFFTWLGTGFRMPLFIGLTGFLFSLERAREMPLPRLLRRYYDRLMLPWLVALAVYLTTTHQLDALTPFHVFVRPPYHFWFVPVMMAFIVAAALTRRSPLFMLGLAIPASIAAMYVFGVGYATQQPHAWMPDRRFFIFPIYFFYGLWVARRQTDGSKLIAAAIVAPIGILWWCSLHGRPNLNAEVAASLLSSLALICLLPIVGGLSVSIPVIAGVGRNSLFFYLWHPMVLAMWSSAGFSGMSMLMLTLLSLFVVGTLIAGAGSVASIFGMTPRRFSPAVLPTAEVALAADARFIDARFVDPAESERAT